MASPLKQRIQSDVTDAMRAKDKPRLGTLRLVTAAIKQIEVDSREDLDDAGVDLGLIELGDVARIRVRASSPVRSTYWPRVNQALALKL